MTGCIFSSTPTGTAAASNTKASRNSDTFASGTTVGMYVCTSGPSGSVRVGIRKEQNMSIFDRGDDCPVFVQEELAELRRKNEQALRRELDALRKQTQWISVKDRLPEVPAGKERIPILVAVDDGYSENGSVHSMDYGIYPPNVTKPCFVDMSYGGYINPAVTHWMPIPKPPEEIK